jgi:signal peptidase II
MVKTKFLLITVAIVILDQLTKFLLKNKFIIITNFLYLNYTENKGASFGLFQGYNLVFIFISIFIIFLMFKFYKKVKNNFKLQLAYLFY